METRKEHSVHPEEDGNLTVALLLAPMLLAICMVMHSIGVGDYSEAWAWGIALLTLFGWLGSKENKHG